MPAKIDVTGPEAPTYNGPPTKFDIVGYAGSVPAYLFPGLPAGAGVLVTSWSHDSTIHVLDQHDDPLHSMYVGAEISEDNGVALNVTLQTGGTYKDRVGISAKPDNPSTPPPPGFPSVVIPLGSPFQTAWETSGTWPPNPNDSSITKTVTGEVGGHALTPALKRKITLTGGAGNLTIELVE